MQILIFWRFERWKDFCLGKFSSKKWNKKKRIKNGKRTQKTNERRALLHLMLDEQKITYVMYVAEFIHWRRHYRCRSRRHLLLQRSCLHDKMVRSLNHISVISLWGCFGLLNILAGVGDGFFASSSFVRGNAPFRPNHASTGRFHPRKQRHPLITKGSFAFASRVVSFPKLQSCFKEGFYCKYACPFVNKHSVNLFTPYVYG